MSHTVVLTLTIRRHWHSKERRRLDEARLHTRRFPSVESVLGVKGVLGAKPQSWLDRLAMMRECIPAAGVESIIGAVHLSQAQLARVLGISERALARRMREGVLSSDESSRLLCLA